MATSKTSELDKAILSRLDSLGGQKVGTDALTFEGNRIILPSVYANDIQGFVKFLKGYIESQNEVNIFSRRYKRRPWDGAIAVRNAFKQKLGVDVVGKASMGFFGPVPPRLIDVAVDVNKMEQAPWGEIDVQLFGGTMHLGTYEDEDYGLCFEVVVEAPKKHASRVEALFVLIQDELDHNSIYRGKVIDGSQHPNFRDPFGTDASRVIYTAQSEADLDANIWTAIEHSDALRELGVPLKRAVLLEGPWGTGKTLAADVTAQKCLENGWTFIYCRPGKDNMENVMKTARLYQPAVVFGEDVDVVASEGERDHVSKLLDLFDGLDAKNNEVIVVLTTNHVDTIHKGMLRPGRLDSIIHIGAMDDGARVKLIKALVPDGMLDKDIDYALVNDAMQGYMPAFVKEAIDRALRYAVKRLDGAKPDALVTSDFVEAANSLREQFNLHEQADEGSLPPTLDMAFEDKVKDVLSRVAIFDTRLDESIRLVTDEDQITYEVHNGGLRNID